MASSTSQLHPPPDFMKEMAARTRPHPAAWSGAPRCCKSDKQYCHYTLVLTRWPRSDEGPGYPYSVHPWCLVFSGVTVVYGSGSVKGAAQQAEEVYITAWPANSWQPGHKEPRVNCGAADTTNIFTHRPSAPLVAREQTLHTPHPAASSGLNECNNCDGCALSEASPPCHLPHSGKVGDRPL